MLTLLDLLSTLKLSKEHFLLDDLDWASFLEYTEDEIQQIVGSVLSRCLISRQEQSEWEEYFGRVRGRRIYRHVAHGSTKLDSALGGDSAEENTMNNPSWSSEDTPIRSLKSELAHPELRQEASSPTNSLGLEGKGSETSSPEFMFQHNDESLSAQEADEDWDVEFDLLLVKVAFAGIASHR